MSATEAQRTAHWVTVKAELLIPLSLALTESWVLEQLDFLGLLTTNILDNIPCRLGNVISFCGIHDLQTKEKPLACLTLVVSCQSGNTKVGCFKQLEQGCVAWAQ